MPGIPLSLRRAGAAAVALVVAASLLIVLLAGCGGGDSSGAAALHGQPGPLTRAGCAGGGTAARTLTFRLPSPDGVRTAAVRVPAAATGHAAPLLVALHGGGDTGAQMEASSGLGRIADAAGFLVAFPDATGVHRYWNLDERHGPDDVGFVAALVDRVAARACVDPHRIFAAGLSNGGGMAARLACALSGRIAGVVVVAGTVAHVPECGPGRPVSVLEIHGSADPHVPYTGDPETGAGAIRDWLADWATRDRCPGAPTHRTIARTVLGLEWDHCADGTRVAHLELLGGGHEWPGSTPDPGSPPKPPSPISAAAEAWRFLAAIPARPGDQG
jgi:polyhydroxybutyrate depolymerase